MDWITINSIIAGLITAAFIYFYYIWSDWDRKHNYRTYLCQKKFGKLLNYSHLLCQPLRTLDALLEFHQNPVQWNSLVVPLQSRSKPRKATKFNLNMFHETEDNEDVERRQVLVCHDFKGNYREDSYINGSEKWDGYRFYNWHTIDIFCYFSHEFVSIPTLQWLNAAHKHGVMVLGTFIVEFARGQVVLEQILSSRELMLRVVDALTLISKYCGFEGWLLNIECGLTKEKVPLLIEFVETLTKKVNEQITNGRVIWYDSITEEGTLRWQNELNAKNKIFFEKSNGIFLNYTWNDKHMENTLETARQLDRQKPRFKDIFVGIDIFGRNQVAKLDTYKTFAQIPERLSVALFAVGWTLESVEHEMRQERKSFPHDETNVRFMNRDRQFWTALWEHLELFGPVKLPFYTSFCMGSGYFNSRFGMAVKQRPWFNLSKQELQPSICTFERDFDDAFDGGSCILITESLPGPQRLFVCQFSHVPGLVISACFKRSQLKFAMEFVVHVYSAELKAGKLLYLVGQEATDVTHKDACCVKPIHVERYREVVNSLQECGQKYLPAVDSINGWEIRHYYLKFDADLRAEVRDFGILVQNMPGGTEGDYVKIGAISILNSTGSTSPTGHKLVDFDLMQSP